jgi:hypothetical protein
MADRLIAFTSLAALTALTVLAVDARAQELATEVGAQKPGRVLALPDDATVPTVDIEVLADPADGWNLHIRTTNFRFTPENVGSPPRDGEGHAHLYINGEKVTRVYGPWFHIITLPSGPCEVAVTLNANNHKILATGDKIISDSEVLLVRDQAIGDAHSDHGPDLQAE